MDSAAKKTNLLILRGVFPGDFTTDVFHEKKTVLKEKIPESDIVYTEIPKKFTGVKSWITFSNLHCWECGLVPSGYPRFIPLHPERSGGEDTCDVYGHFCEWNCAVAFATKEFSRERQPDILNTILLFESKFSGQRKKKIMPCPPKTEMKQYCGNKGLTVEQWKSKLVQLNSDYNLTNYKLEHFRNGEK